MKPYFRFLTDFSSSVLLTLFLLLSLQSFAQFEQRSLCLLDLQIQNSESNDSRVYSAKQMACVAGMPTTITQDLDEALLYGVIFCSSELKASTFNAAETAALVEYVENGGVLIAPRVVDEDLYELFGIEGSVDAKNRYFVDWEIAQDEKLFRWIDEDYEQTVSLGRPSQGDIYKTYAYDLTTAESLGTYEDDGVAFCRNNFGAGTAYALGFSLKEVILRNQINRDYEAQRITSNGFEPTQDVFFFLLRNIFNKHIPYGTWKHTSPNNSTSSLLITHDIDSKTGMDTLNLFTEDEKARGIVATYNVTVRYFDDDIISAFYSYGSSFAMPIILDAGHKLGSHSVGHFFDFADDDIFPIGAPGNTKENYSPYNNGDITTGGTVFGECEVAKNMLEEDTGEDIRIFRAGHLAANKYLTNVLEALGYEYNSNYTSSDVLTNFPYMEKMGRSFSGDHTNVMQIPVTISDVFNSDPISANNIDDKVATWLDVLGKNDANHANTCLLIHPNRTYKAEGQEDFLDQIPSTVSIKEMADFGDYWRNRTAATFYTLLDDYNNTLSVVLDLESYQSDEQLSFIITDGQEVETIEVLDQHGNVLYMEMADWAENDVIIYHSAPVISSVKNIKAKVEDLVIYPNPVQDDVVNLNVDFIQGGKCTANIYDLNGRLMYAKQSEQGADQQIMKLEVDQLISGVYFVEVINGDERRRARLVIL